MKDVLKGGEDEKRGVRGSYLGEWGIFQCYTLREGSRAGEAEMAVYLGRRKKKKR